MRNARHFLSAVKRETGNVKDSKDRQNTKPGWSSHKRNFNAETDSKSNISECHYASCYQLDTGTGNTDLGRLITLLLQYMESSHFFVQVVV